MFFISLAPPSCCTLVMALAAMRAKNPRRVYWKSGFGLLFGMVPCFVVFPTYLYYSALLTAFAIGCSAAGLRPRTFVTAHFQSFWRFSGLGRMQHGPKSAGRPLCTRRNRSMNGWRTKTVSGEVPKRSVPAQSGDHDADWLYFESGRAAYGRELRLHALHATL